jgi:hypothetical protein
MSISIRHLPMAAALMAAAACAFTASPARAAAICGSGTYAYAGFDGRSPSTGVSATIAQAGPLQVSNGHVAGWIGVVDASTGSAWLQVGMSALPNATTSAIYYEVAVPGQAPVYHLVKASVTPGVAHRFAVLEQPWNPGTWVVWVDGAPVGGPISLPGSHGRWSAQALGESWAGTASGACNKYAYAFGNVSLLGGPRQPAGVSVTAVQDPSYAIVRLSQTSFVATSASS